MGKDITNVFIELESADNSESINNERKEAHNNKINKNLEFIQNFDLNKHPENVSYISVVKKLDKRLLLPMAIIYTLQFLDKVILNYAKIMGMPTDLGFSGNQFSELPTFFFVAYICAEFFQGFFLIQKFPVAQVLGGNVVLWGIFVACSGATQNFGSMMALRVLLGLAESAVAPCLTLITTNFYLKSDGNFRIGIWYSGLGFGQILGGIISYLFQLVNLQTISGWRIMFIVIGIINTVAGLYVWFFIPSTALSSNFLTHKEKYVLLIKLNEEKMEVNSSNLVLSQAIELFSDIQAWLFLILAAAISFSSNTISTFSSTDIISFGFSSKQAALLNMPSGVVSIVSSCVATFFIMKGVPRYLGISILLLPAICGAALMSFLPKSNKGGLIVGIYMINTVTPPLAICYAWAGANFAGSTKKIGSTTVFISIGFALGNILGPLSYRVEDAPDYFPAKISMLITQGASIILAFIVAGIYFIRNKKRDKEQENQEDYYDRNDELAQSDQTDFQNRYFRYSY